MPIILQVFFFDFLRKSQKKGVINSPRGFREPKSGVARNPFRKWRNSSNFKVSMFLNKGYLQLINKQFTIVARTTKPATQASTNFVILFLQ